ncbi:hypothetical protein HU200_000287 [Digitaria exilis]|uniref:Glutamine amidotransferase domain-containing protein n=1 Tax=Digitaria exilis TaxID=1010633 RepID=A0A835G1W7_9POAL|nr:hypothetical protein HU200_000287 [Digitaria exilis]
MTVATPKPAAAGCGGRRRYALLLALWDSDYATKVYGGYHNVFVSAFGSGAGERWDSYRVIAGEFPSLDDLASYDGFVVSGSPHDAHGEDPWIHRLCGLLRTLHAMGKRVLGVCFGHQLLCRALGGRVARARNGWDVGVRNVTFARGLVNNGSLGFLGDDLGGELELLLPTTSAAIVEVHQDEVWEIPPGATVVAYSEKTRVEAFVVGENVLGVQGHPEYTTDILLNLVDRLTGHNAIDTSVGDEARRTVAVTGGPDRAFWTALCKGFLRGRGGGGAGFAAGARRCAYLL